MQSIIVLSLLISISIFMLIEDLRFAPASVSQYPQYQALRIAGNILQYNYLLMQYMVANYNNLHMVAMNDPGSVAGVVPLNYTQDNIADFSQKNFMPFMQYNSIAFNYVPNESVPEAPLPILYLATSWNGYAAGINLPHLSGMPEVMGELNQLLTDHVYQGDTTYWTTPWLLQQSNCNIQEIFSQVANDENNNPEYSQVATLFNQFCLQIQNTSNYVFGEWVYVSPIIINE